MLSYIIWRSELLTHPKVHRMAWKIGCSVPRILGAMSMLYLTADQHADIADGDVDAVMSDLSPEDADALCDLPGFCEAIESVGWLRRTEDGRGVILVNWMLVNAPNAKRRAMDAKRKQIERATKERVAKAGPVSENSGPRSEASGPPAKNADLRREEKRRDTETTTPRAREENPNPTVPDEPPSEVVDAFERWKRESNDAYRLTEMDHRAITCWWRDEAPESDVDVGEGTMTPVEIFVAAVADAVANGVEFSGRAAHALKYITKTIERCVSERRRPGVKSHEAKRSGGGYRDAAAERRAKERAGQHPEDLGIDTLPIITFP